MLAKSKSSGQLGFYSTFEEQLNHNHPLYILAGKINWPLFEDSFRSLYSSDKGRPAKPIRLMVSLLLLKHIRNLSDESVVEQWSENSYYQYLSGEKVFACGAPCEASELVHFRHRIGEKGIELILQESIRINGKDGEDGNVSIDTTVQEKNITYPTDSKLHRKIIKKCLSIAGKHGLPVRQRYTRTVKSLSLALRFSNHPRNRGRASRAARKLKTIAGRLLRELVRNLPPQNRYQSELEVCKRILSQTRNDRNKIYSLHEPDVLCISKGKEHKKYEFGNKVALVVTQNTGVIVGALGFRNEYDGHTLERSLEQTERLTGLRPRTATVDRGCKGRTRIGETDILIPGPRKNLNSRQKAKLKKQFRRRAAIEPVIGHLKAEHRLNRNFYKGITGDNINIMLCAAAFNFKRMMNKWKSSLRAFLQTIFCILKSFADCFAKGKLNAKIGF
jgi:IS5 family transposase